MYNNKDMHIKGEFFKPLPRVFIVFSVSLLLVTVSCHGGMQTADERWVDSVLQACDSIELDTLAYEVVEEEPAVSVDENFNDFLFDFLHNRKFQSERVQLPLPVCDAVEVGGTEVRDIHDFRKLLQDVEQDYFVLLLPDINDLATDPSSCAQQARIHLVSLLSSMVSSLYCSREEGKWMVKSLMKHPLTTFVQSDFMHFYQQFANDTLYQASHVKHPLTVYLEDEDYEGEIIEGSIDADQFPVFSPVLPQDRFMVIEYGRMVDEGSEKAAILPAASLDRRCVMVKCGIGNGMMDVLTFEKEGEEWMLTEIEN